MNNRTLAENERSKNPVKFNDVKNQLNGIILKIQNMQDENDRKMRKKWNLLFQE